MNKLELGYYHWLCSFVYDMRYISGYTYNKLFEKLFDTKFYSLVRYDENRAGDGLELRNRYCSEIGLPIDDLEDELPKDCTVLEVMIALALRCEENIMSDEDEGNRTGQWFWSMVASLGLSRMTDRNFDSEETENILYRFLERDYEPDGRGSLFTVPNAPYDVRTIEIWDAMGWYLDDVLRDEGIL